MELIKFTTLDDYILNGFLDRSDNKKEIKDRKIVIYTHGITSNCFENKNRVIANRLNEKGIDFFSFNNRGTEIAYKMKNAKPDMGIKMAGSAFENIFECENDIISAINKVLDLGYTKIILLGHSLSCTKMMFTLKNMEQNSSKFLEYIKGVGFLSMVDIPRILKLFLNTKYVNVLDYARKKQKNNQGNDLMPIEYTYFPMCVNTFLLYAEEKTNKNLDFINIHNGDHLKDLNSIEVPLFMRWGDTQELVEYPTKRYVNIINKKIKKWNKDIDYIEGANHSYEGCEETLAREFIKFVEKI